jgi:hypothetical protein
MTNHQKYKPVYLASPQNENVHWNSYDGNNAKCKATQLQAYLMTQVMATSTTRGKLKKLIDLGTDVGTAGTVIGMTTIDIRAAPQNCGDMSYQNSLTNRFGYAIYHLGNIAQIVVRLIAIVSGCFGPAGQIKYFIISVKGVSLLVKIFSNVQNFTNIFFV